MSNEKSYNSFMKSLESKIRAEEIGMKAWGGRRTQSKPQIQPTIDTLLNSGAKLNKLQNERENMLQDYLKSQETPIERIDPATGELKSFKYHSLESPDVEGVILRSVDGRVVDIPPTDLNHALSNLTLEAPILLKQKHDDNDIALKIDFDHYERLLENIRTDIITLNDYKLENEIILKENLDEYLNNPNHKKKKKKDKKQQYIYELEKYDHKYKQHMDDIINERNLIYAILSDIREGMRQSVANREADNEHIEEGKASIQAKIKENADKLKAYGDELTSMNSGKLSTQRDVTETDEEYIERMNVITAEPLTNRTYEKAIIQQKQDLRENLLSITRDRSIVDQVVNSLSSTDEALVYSVNTRFEGFKTYFIKKYGSSNKNITALLILTEIVDFLRGNNNNQLIIQPRQFRQAPDIHISPLINPDDLDDLDEEVTFNHPEHQIIIDRPDENTLELDKNGKKLYLRYATLYTGRSNKTDTYTPPISQNRTIFLYSDTGQLGTFIMPDSDAATSGIVGIVKKYFDATNEEISNIFDTPIIKNQVLVTKDNLVKFFQDHNIEAVDQSLISDRPMKKAGTTLTKHWGMGLNSHPKSIPDVIEFGDKHLLLKKLYLNNILSIKNKHNLKISGFNNVKVSDLFIEIIYDIINNSNYHNKLNKLSEGEQELLEHLLKVCNLHKIHGSSINIDKLKKGLEILEGEIQAGNNNKLLQKKLRDILNKMVHYNLISAPQSNKHLKQYDVFFK